MNDLIEMVKAGAIDSAKAQIHNGADVNAQDEQGWTPLNWAAGRGDVEIVKVLIALGANIHKTGRDQRTPYQIALAASQIQVAKLLDEASKKIGDSRHIKRTYCKAYCVSDLLEYPHWSDQAENLTQNEVVFLHADLCVTGTMWADEDVIFDRVTPEWRRFCKEKLGFRVPSDFDLIRQTF